jgi:hypothetical protein
VAAAHDVADVLRSPAEDLMRIVALCSLVFAGVFALAAPAAAFGPPWCAAYRNGSTNCGFYTYQQCMDTVAGNGGFCNRNYIDGPPEKPAAGRSSRPTACRGVSTRTPTSWCSCTCSR